MSELQEAIRRLPVDWPDWTDVGISVSFSVPAEHLEVRRQLQRADSMRSLWPSLVSAVSCMEDTPSLRILVDTTLRLLSSSCARSQWQERQLALNPADTPWPASKQDPPPGPPLYHLQ